MATEPVQNPKPLSNPYRTLIGRRVIIASVTTIIRATNKSNVPFRNTTLCEAGEEVWMCTGDHSATANAEPRFETVCDFTGRAS